MFACARARWSSRPLPAADSSDIYVDSSAADSSGAAADSSAIYADCSAADSSATYADSSADAAVSSSGGVLRKSSWSSPALPLFPACAKIRRFPHAPMHAAPEHQQPRLTSRSLLICHSDFVHFSLDLIWDRKVAKIANNHLAIRAHRVAAGLVRDADSR